MSSPVHLHEPSSFHTALCGVLGRLGRPEAGTEEEGEEEEEEVAHFAQGHTCVRILWQAGLKDLCCSQSLFRGLPKPLPPRELDSGSSFSTGARRDLLPVG